MMNMQDENAGFTEFVSGSDVEATWHSYNCQRATEHRLSTEQNRTPSVNAPVCARSSRLSQICAPPYLQHDMNACMGRTVRTWDTKQLQEHGNLIGKKTRSGKDGICMGGPDSGYSTAARVIEKGGHLMKEYMQ